MAVYEWPVGQKAFWPRQARWHAIYNERATVSALSGYTQTGSTPGARWGLSLDIPQQSYAERRALAAFIDRLQGNKHRVGMYDPAHPSPAGAIALAGVTLAAAAGQFSSVLTLAGCRPANNLVQNSSFEGSVHGDGTGDGWSFLSAGSVSGLAAAMGDGLAVHGAQSQVVLTTSLGTGAGDYAGIRQWITVSGSAGQPWSAAASVLASAGSTVRVHIQFLLSGSFVGEIAGAAATASGAEQRISASGLAPAAFDQIELQIRQSAMPSVASSYLYVDAVQLERAAAPTAYTPYATLLGGDWLGVGGQLLRVVANAVGDLAGAMTVEVCQPLRQSLASGTAVVLDRPTTQMVLQLSSGQSPHIPFDGNGLAPAFTLELVEAWA